MKILCTDTPPGRSAARIRLSPSGVLPGVVLALALDLLFGWSWAWAQPDYAPAHWTPPVGCDKWWTSGADALA